MGGEVFFLPKPFVPYNAGDLTNIAKKVKKARWLDTAYYSKVLRNEHLGLLGESEDNKQGGAHLKGEYLTTRKIDADFLDSYTVPRIRVPRSGAENNGNTEIFYMERLMFKEGSGLYFIADGDTTLLEKALELLQYDGIGTDRKRRTGTIPIQKGYHRDSHSN
jgi:CRISPR type III-A-associated RAMP protein Csm4